MAELTPSPDAFYSHLREVLHRSLSLAAAAFSLEAGGLGAEEPPFVEFIRVAANTGNSAGGHAALRIGDWVYHYQAGPDKLLMLTRDSWEFFLRRYGMLDNRGLYLSHLDVSLDTGRTLKTRLDRLYVVQQRHVDRFQALGLEGRWLAAITSGRQIVSAAGIGLFVTDPNSVSPDVGYLKEQVDSQLGDGWLENEIALVDAAIEHDLLEVSDPGEVPPQAGEFPRVGEVAAEVLRERLLWRASLSALRKRLPVAPDVLASADPPRLTLAERRRLEELVTRLEGSVLRLLQSPRPDRGEALLFSIARFCAARRSIESGRLVLVDAYAKNIVVLEADEVERHHDLVEVLADQAADVLAGTRRELIGEDAAVPLGEPGLARLEELTARFAEIRAAATDGTDLRVAYLPGRRATLRAGETAVPALRAQPGDAAATAAVESDARRERYRGHLYGAYGYSLTRHNCSTELLLAIDSAFPNRGAGAALGGTIAARKNLTFIPSELDRQVRLRWDVISTRTILSHRHQQVDAMAAAGNAPLVRLRESNTVSASAYPGSINDDAFLFFSDGTRVLRPIQGIANLGFGFASSGIGVLTLPVDGGRRATDGLRGVFYSFPELVGLSIRKGRYDVLPVGDSEAALNDESP